MKLKIINGPNLNILNKREKEYYGQQSFEEFFSTLQFKYKSAELAHFQSNVEGELINELQECDDDGYDGIILNAAGYTHTSVSIGDTVAAIDTPIVEVHISNIAGREEFRHTSYVSPHAIGVVAGFGLEGYELAIQYFMDFASTDQNNKKR